MMVTQCYGLTSMIRPHVLHVNKSISVLSDEMGDI
jgi:hypothetical protein